MFYFFLKRIIYCPWSTKLYLQTFALATQMDISWHTTAYSYHRRILPCTEFMEDYLKHNREQNSFIYFPLSFSTRCLRPEISALKLYNLFLGRGRRNLIKFLFGLYLKRKQLCHNNVQLVFAKQIYPKCNSSSTSLSKSKRGE